MQNKKASLKRFDTAKTSVFSVFLASYRDRKNYNFSKLKLSWPC